MPTELRHDSTAVSEIELPGLTPWRRGKVRAIYEAGPDTLVMVASDRLSAFDHVLPTPIPDKGMVLTRLSAFWMHALPAASPHHMITDDPARYPAPFDRFRDRLAGRSMLVRRAERFDIECVVRGYLTGSGWKEYQRTGAVCGVALPPGLHDGSQLEQPIFTPATKADTGHDVNISFEQAAEIVGLDAARELRDRSLALYREAHHHALPRGLVLADTKFEFGRVDGRVTLIDEVLSPDSSRWWDRDAYDAGRLESFDKQVVRDWLDGSGWNHEPPAPALPPEVVARTRARYLEAMQRLTGAA
jgi:phosphoribosylaminoimidazole-succinocarboxamide synthase